ncbi:MAG: type I-G CRISPR-associated protein Cas7 [Gammaproteobacteria bacterium]
MPEQKNLDPKKLIKDDGPLRMIFKAQLRPVAELDRFQPAGFPEIGHVIYKAPRVDGALENVCIVDSPASMANHLESVCRRAPHDPDAVSALDGMPYLRCVTDAGWPNHEDEENKHKPKQVVATSLTEGHRIASTYFLNGRRLEDSKSVEDTFDRQLANECGIPLRLGKKAHPSPDAWWKVFSTIFRYDPNALVHGVLFPQWQIKIPRMLTAHLEAFGAGRVDRSGVKFDRLGKTTSGQPIFAIDDATAGEIKATFILDIALLRSFGRAEDGSVLGLKEEEKVFLLALSLWKIGRLLRGPFRFRSGCDLECAEVSWDGGDVKDALTEINISQYIEAAKFPMPVVTNIYWSAGDLYREGEDQDNGAGSHDPETPEDGAANTDDEV